MAPFPMWGIWPETIEAAALVLPKAHAEPCWGHICLQVQEGSAGGLRQGALPSGWSRAMGTSLLRCLLPSHSVSAASLCLCSKRVSKESPKEKAEAQLRNVLKAL